MRRPLLASKIMGKMEKGQRRELESDDYLTICFTVKTTATGTSGQLVSRVVQYTSTKH